MIESCPCCGNNQTLRDIEITHKENGLRQTREDRGQRVEWIEAIAILNRKGSNGELRVDLLIGTWRRNKEKKKNASRKWSEADKRGGELQSGMNLSIGELGVDLLIVSLENGIMMNWSI